MIDVLDGINLAAASFDYNTRREISTSVAGSIYSRAMGPTLWSCSYTTVPMVNSAAARLLARLYRCEEDGDVFEGYDPRHPNPTSSPGTGGLGSVVIAGISSDNREVSLSGLPGSFVVTAGDYLAWSHSSGRVLHRFSEDRVAGTGGVLALTEVVPPVLPGGTTGANVTMRKASALFAIVPGSVGSQQVDTLHHAVTWSGIQVID